MTQQLVTDELKIEGTATRSTRDRAALPRPRRAAAPDGAGRQDVLRRAVEDEVIPRLLARRNGVPGRAFAGEAGTSVETVGTLPNEVSGLVDLLLTGEQPASASFVEAMRAVGTSPESLYLDVLTPAARRLGVMWEEDDCDFSEVTIGLCRLHAIMRSLSTDFLAESEAPAGAPRALLIQMPGEQHGLGLAMVVQFFRRAGWNVCHEPVATSEDLVELVRRRPFELVGISVSCSERLEALAADIRAIRRRSCNGQLRIMVGGPLFIDHPQLASMVGADGTAADAREAVQLARVLVSSMAPDR